jgi:hypothetical protein
MGKRDEMRAAIARQKEKEAEAAMLQAVAGGAGEPPAKRAKRKELASRPNPPAAPKAKKPRPRRDAKSRDERVAPAVRRLPPGSVITKSWDGEKWHAVLSIPTPAPDGRDGWTSESDGSFRGEEELFQMYLKSLEETK